eukprot:CAMPEP_0171138106 /NCGR_PEP_ID=MMETSP0766_2-20121228/134514_1 /TAXON_ID=439317 /ORGANISM="Gambierdiscus australes, Strain CAWD 149" /LENGTH=71 /DNA_ID=CAMNT_0011601713 /DNA_START=132 /DNA_END=344 /DNA_ORIENTATION=-
MTTTKFRRMNVATNVSIQVDLSNVRHLTLIRGHPAMISASSVVQAAMACGSRWVFLRATRPISLPFGSSEF